MPLLLLFNSSLPEITCSLSDAFGSSVSDSNALLGPVLVASFADSFVSNCVCGNISDQTLDDITIYDSTYYIGNEHCFARNEFESIDLETKIDMGIVTQLKFGNIQAFIMDVPHVVFEGLSIVNSVVTFGNSLSASFVNIENNALAGYSENLLLSGLTSNTWLSTTDKITATMESSFGDIDMESLFITSKAYHVTKHFGDIRWTLHAYLT